MAAIVSGLAPVNGLMGMIQNACFGRKIEKTKFAGTPVFILGHWRSGTTLLHELMVLDSKWGYPTSFQCFAPHHFLLTEWQFNLMGNWLLPQRRPMDNMQAGWSRPQEDEFALLALGVPSPYRRMAFPNEPAPDMNYLDWTDISESQQERWIEALRLFLQSVTYKTAKPLVLKSPTHTGRVAVLAKAFPDAKFIHIVRDPRSVFPSTCRLWKSLDVSQSFHPAHHRELEDYVIECHQRMYRAFHEGRDRLPADRIVDVRYEDLVSDPVAQMQSIYEHLKLGDFSRLRGPLESWVESQHRGYKTNRHSLSDDIEQRLKDCWQDYFERYGYW